MNKVLISGASRGIGLELCRQLLERGDSILGGCRDPQKAHLLSKLQDNHKNLEIVELDVDDEESVQNCFNQLNLRGRELTNSSTMPGSLTGVMYTRLVRMPFPGFYKPISGVLFSFSKTLCPACRDLQSPGSIICHPGSAQLNFVAVPNWVVQLLTSVLRQGLIC